MPYKFNDGRRHKIPKAKYRVTNWPDYDAALVRRGSLTGCGANFPGERNETAGA